MATTISIAGPGPQSEGSNGSTTNFVFTVTRSGDLGATSAVDYFLAPNSGQGVADPADFARIPSGTVYFAAGETTKTVTAQVNADTAVELDDSFAIGLSNPRGATIEAGRASATIVNDDGGTTPPAVNLSWGTAGSGVSRQEGDSGTTTFTYVLNRSGDTSGATTVDYLVRPVSASANDFAGPLSGTVSFAPGELSKEIQVLVAGDTAAENDESFQVELSNAPGATLPQPLPGRIVNDDGIAATPTFSISGPAPTAEGTGSNTALEFTVTRSGDASSFGIVDYYTVGDTDSADFAGRTTGSVYFAAGETAKTIRLEVVGDSVREADESFFVGLSNARGGTIATAKASTVIQNDDADTPPMATLSWGTAASGITQNEGDSGSTAFTYVVNRSGDLSGTTSADWKVNLGATTPDDFSGPTTGTVVFAPGETSKSFTVGVAGDTAPESDETFTVQLQNSPGAALPPVLAGKIVNDDTGAAGPATVAIAGPGERAEGTGSNTVFDFTVTRSGELGGNTLVDYYLVGEANAADFTGRTTGTVYFAPGESSKVVQITVVGDATAEPDEDFLVGLSNVRGGVIGVGSAPASIIDDDGWVVA